MPLTLQLNENFNGIHIQREVMWPFGTVQSICLVAGGLSKLVVSQ